MNRINLYLLIIIVLVSIVYVRTFDFEFVDVDDKRLVIKNPLVTDSTIPYSEAFDKFKGSVHYKPLVFLTWKLQYNLFGDSASHFHVVNWLLHLINSVILFFIGIQLFTFLFHDYKKSLFLSLFLSLFFSLNPLRVESVAWVTERKDVLFSLFYLSGWYFYNHYAKNSQKFFYLMIAALFYFLGGLSKSMALTFVAIPFLMDFYFKRKFTKKIVFEKIPFFIVLIILMSFFGLLDLGGGRELTEMAGERNTELVSLISSHEFINSLPFLIQRLLSSSVQFILWIVHILIPVKLSITYPHDAIFEYLGYSIYVFPIIILITYSFLIIKFKKFRVIFFGLLFFGITLSPALLIPISGRTLFLADRYTYIPSIGIFFILVYVISKMKSVSYRNSLFVLVLLFYVLTSTVYVKKWENTESLFSHSLKVFPLSGMLYNGLGNYYRENNNFDKALEYYSKGIDFEPGNHRLFNNRGVIYLKKQDWNKAKMDFTHALELNSNYLNALSNRGMVYFKQQNYDELIGDYKKYLSKKPRDHAHHYRIALSYYMVRNYEEALAHIEKAISLDPNKEYIFIRSYIFNGLGQKKKALNDALKAQQMGKAVNESYINQLKNN